MIKEQNGDTNNNTMNTMNKRTTSMRKSNPIKPSRSHGNLIDNKFYMSDDAEVVKEKKNLVKRTKSFWKFGKHASDNEILEGMALWRHRDLVDVNDEKNKLRRKINSQDRVRRPSRDKSNDSDKTINNNIVNNKESNEEKQKGNTKSKDIRHSKSFNEKQKPKKTSKVEREDYKDYNKSSSPTNFDDQFYDDDGDGLMLKTVNRKNILQQYSNDSTGSDSEAESDMTSDDPYDSILIDDQKVKKNENSFPNVAELGKKLEKLSKSSKYTPNKDNNLNNQTRTNVQEKNNINMRLERNNSVKKNSPDREDEDIYQYHDKRHTNNTFKTFGIDPQSNENGEKDELDDRYYSQTHKRSNGTSAQEKRRYYSESNNRNSSMDRRGRPSYESIDSDVERRNKDNRTMTSNRRSHGDTIDKRDKVAKYYDSTTDELSDAVDNKQFLPRTKLAKTNSNNSTHSKYEQEIGLMEYGETLQKRLKNPEYNSKFDEKSPHNGNMYGPWYDLWGLDSTGTSPRK